MVNLLLRNENSALTAILLALLSFASTAAAAGAAGATGTIMLAACILSRASRAFHFTLVKDAFRVGRARILVAAIPVWFPSVIVALFLGILCFVPALVEAVKTFVELFIESRREGEKSPVMW